MQLSSCHRATLNDSGETVSKIRPYCQAKTFLVFCLVVSVFIWHTVQTVERIDHSTFSLHKTIYFQPLFCSAGLSKVPGTLNLFY